MLIGVTWGSILRQPVGTVLPGFGQQTELPLCEFMQVTQVMSM
jgi:hypothetical protein